ncbi:MAG TPA: porin [Bradyrhizobium sp.]|nr:porin [Bradyrhizobium sp.]
MKGAAAGNSCAAFGPGFVKVDGTETCVKIGGAVSIGVGGSSGVR